MAQIEEVLLTDLAHISDLKKSATGDLDIISGLANLKNALYHRLITEPGTLIHRPSYGVGIKQYQNAPNSITAQRQLALKIQEQFKRDPRVEEVLGVSVSHEDATPHLVMLVIRVKVVGYGESELKFTPFGEGI